MAGTGTKATSIKPGLRSAYWKLNNLLAWKIVDIENEKGKPIRVQDMARLNREREEISNAIEAVASAIRVVR